MANSTCCVHPGYCKGYFRLHYVFIKMCVRLGIAIVFNYACSLAFINFNSRKLDLIVADVEAV